MVKESAYDTGGLGSIPGLGRLPLEKGMATHSSVRACRMPRAEEPGGLQSMGLQTVGHNEATNAMTTCRSHRRPPAGRLNISVRDRVNSHREQATRTQTRDVYGNRHGLFLQPDELHRLRFSSQKEGKRQKKLLLPEDGEAPALGSGPWGSPHFLVRWRVCLSTRFMFLNNRNTIKKNRNTLSH